MFPLVAPLFTNITGYANMIANGANKLTLSCTTDSSNPASTIAWYINGDIISLTGGVSQSAGSYGGRITTNVLELFPTREMDGYIVVCKAHNSMSLKNVSSSVTLDLKCK